MTNRVHGTFEVKMTPIPPSGNESTAFLGRFSLDKLFNGDLEASSKGEMLSAGNVASGSAGYVALEKVSGALTGKSGTFVLQHNGVMNKGDARLSIEVVPDSGTEELVGLSGKMTIIIEDGKHLYDFEYELPG